METKSLTRRELLVHDALAFSSLTLVTVVLFAVTLFLFRSFSAHRATLAVDWAGRGQQALDTNQPQQAIQDLRTALSFAPGTHDYELLLARSLAAAGPQHTEEAYNYFLGLWEEEPGNGEINLELARLAARKGNRDQAVNYYLSAMDGRWEGNGVLRRRGARLELAQYLIAQHDISAARTELLLAGSNAIDNPAAELQVARLLQQAADPTDALAYYEKSIAQQPDDAVMVEAGKLAYSSGDFATAFDLLQRGSREGKDPEAAALRDQVERLLQLAPSEKLTPIERVRRIVAVRAIAKHRWDECTQQKALTLELIGLAARWKAAEATASAIALLRDPALQDIAVQLAYDTETATSHACGAPSGDDALLLELAKAPKAGQ